jgi:hypothetical protein
MEAVMLHSLQPAEFIVRRRLQTPCECPLCDRPFVFGKGVMALAHYRDADTDEVRQGLMCFCSTRCLLLWEPSTMMGLMH